MSGAIIAVGLIVLIIVAVAIWLLVAKFATHTWPFEVSKEDKTKYISNACSTITAVMLASTTGDNLNKAYDILKGQKDDERDCSKITDLIAAAAVDKPKYINNACPIYTTSNLAATPSSNITAAYNILISQTGTTKDCSKISNLIAKSSSTSTYIMGASLYGGGMTSQESQLGGMDIVMAAPF